MPRTVAPHGGTVSFASHAVISLTCDMPGLGCLDEACLHHSCSPQQRVSFFFFFFWPEKGPRFLGRATVPVVKLEDTQHVSAGATRAPIFFFSLARGSSEKLSVRILRVCVDPSAPRRAIDCRRCETEVERKQVVASQQGIYISVWFGLVLILEQVWGF